MSAGQWFKRKWRNFYLKIVREKATPEYIARGWSIGMFFGCLIPIGGQLFCSIPTAFLLKGSKIGAVLGTFITNQITIFFIYPAQCYAGAKLLGMDISYRDVASTLKEVTLNPSVDALKRLCHEAGDVAGAFFLGGAIMALVFTPLTYIVVRQMVIKHRIRVEKRRRKRRAVLRERVRAMHRHEAERQN